MRLFRLRCPGRELDTGLMQDPVAERQDKAGFLRQRDELAGRDESALRMQPAHQCFGADHAARRIHLRLIVKNQLVLEHGLAQIDLHVRPRLDRILHRRIEETQGVAPGRLGLVHRRVRALHQLIDADRITQKQGNPRTRCAVMIAHARTIGVQRDVELVGPAQLRLDLVGHVLRLNRRVGAFVEIFEQDNEFVPTEARHRVTFPDARFQAGRDFDQQLVAHGMAQGVVEGLEVVEVDQHQRTVPAMPCAAVQRLAQTIEHQPPIGKPGQVIEKGQMPDFVFGGLAQGDVGKGCHVVRDMSAGPFHGRDRQPFRIGLAVLAAIPDLALPRPLRKQALPHLGIESLALPVRLQDAVRTPHGLGRGVAGNPGEGTVDSEYDSLGIRDRNPLLRLEGGGGDPQVGRVGL